MSNKQFEGKVIIVTGAGTGMGADTAILLAARGAKVTIVGRREAPLREIETKILAEGGEALTARANTAFVASPARLPWIGPRAAFGSTNSSRESSIHR